MRYSQPQSGPFQLDPGSALARGLSFCLDQNGTDLVTGKQTKLPSAPVKGGIAADLQTNNVSVYASPALALGSEWTIAYSFIPTSLAGGTFDLFFERNAKADSNHFELYKDRDSGKFAMYLVPSGGGGFAAGPVMAAGVQVDAVITCSAGTLKLFLNGALAISVAYAGVIGGTTNWLQFNPTESGTSNGRQKVLFFRTWSRALADLEVAAHYANPWQIIKSPRRVLLSSGVVTPAGTFSSTLDNTVFSASGAVTDVGSFSSSLAATSMAASGSVLDPGSFATILAGAVMVASGAVAGIGQLAATLAGAIMSASGSGGTIVLTNIGNLVNMARHRGRR